ncbi:MAG TPA: nucleotidyltransferase family protein, partial [Nitrospira sp.]|nr:nucleotidyltransferase family protein [Nitrospira sp.]
GAVLAAVAYQDPTLRDVDDIGFIVPRRRLADAQRALWAQAYRPRERWPQDGTEEGRDCLYVKKNSVLKVELQWVMAREHFQFLLDRPEVWERLSAVSFQGRTLQVLPPEELLAILCVHGSKRAWEKLKWAVDVAELVRASRLDWRRVFARAAQWKCRRMVLLGLGLAHHLLNASVPPTILSEFCADRDCPELAMRMPKSLLLRPDEGIGADAAPALYCSLKDSRRDRWRYEFVLLWHDHPILRRLPDWLRSRKSLARFASIAQAVRASWLFCRCMEIKTAVAGSKPSPR